MGALIEVPEAPALDPESFLERVRSRLDPDDKDSALALAPDLAALARNPSFLADRLAESLQDWARFQPGNPYVFPCFVLGRGPGWMVRANYWRPAAEVGRGDGNDRIDFYAVCHNHTFSFLSAALAGPGYRTRLWRLDPEATQRLGPGDPVAMGAAREFTLGPGRVMFYERLVDAHIQFPPEEPSLSLNLALLPASGNLLEQLYIDAEAQRVIQVRGAYTEGLASLAHLAGALGGPRLLDCLEAVAARSPAPRVRAAALDALARHDAERAAACAGDDPHPWVRQRRGVIGWG